MLYGAHCYLLTPRWGDDQLRHLDTARKLGLDMFELSVGDDIHFDHGRTGRHARELGLHLLVGPGGAWPMECDLSSESASDRAKGLDWHKRVVDITAEVGASAYAGAMYGHPGMVKRRRPPADEYARTAEGVHALAEYAAERNVVLAMEPMSHFRTHMVNTPAQALKLIALADNHPALRVLFDTYHLVTEVRDYVSALRMLGDRLFAIHACENDRGRPGGGLIPWLTFFRTLREIGFNGYVGLEGYNSGIGDFAYERGMFHDVCPDGRAFIAEGIAYLRSVEQQAAAD
jgi:D-psicose/D-tagatose/L-ribulose 3-epimerase